MKCVRPALEMEASKQEQRDVVRFLVLLEEAKFIVACLLCMYLTSVHEWQKKFREGRTSLREDSRPGQAITPHVTARIDG